MKRTIHVPLDSELQALPPCAMFAALWLKIKKIILTTPFIICSAISRICYSLQAPQPILQQIAQNRATKHLLGVIYVLSEIYTA